MALYGRYFTLSITASQRAGCLALQELHEQKIIPTSVWVFLDTGRIMDRFPDEPDRSSRKYRDMIFQLDCGPRVEVRVWSLERREVEVEEPETLVWHAIHAIINPQGEHSLYVDYALTRWEHRPPRE